MRRPKDDRAAHTPTPRLIHQLADVPVQRYAGSFDHRLVVTMDIRAMVEMSAHSYAWEYFKLHAQQRQSVFNFFIVISGAVITGYIGTHSQTLSPQLEDFRWVFGAALVVLTFLFWRLDNRNSSLVKLAEAHLRNDENRWAAVLKTDTIKIFEQAGHNPERSFVFRHTSTFGQNYRLIFWLYGLLGAAMISGYIAFAYVFYSTLALAVAASRK
jgi:hypothetical protein